MARASISKTVTTRRVVKRDGVTVRDTHTVTADPGRLGEAVDIPAAPKPRLPKPHKAPVKGNPNRR